MGDEPLVRLVNRIYAGAVDPRAWPGIVKAVAQFIGAPRARLFTPSRDAARGGLDISYGIPALVPQEGLAVLDAHFAFSTDSLGARLSLHRPTEERGFGKEERRRMRLLLPHLARALGVMHRLRDAELKGGSSLAALDRLATGVVLVDGRGAVAHANRAAERIFDAGEGLVLLREAGSSLGRLAPLDAAAQAALARAIDSMPDPRLLQAEDHSLTMLVPHSPSGRSRVLGLAPLPPAAGFETAAGPARAIVFILDSDRSSDFLDAELLRRLYGVTQAEARLAARLFSGETLADAASHCGIAQATARTQLRGIFEKTGTHRQAELVRLLVALTAA